MKQPLVSIVIPLYNGENYILEALESARGQDYPHTEIIVVDDGSTDGSPTLMSEQPGVEYVRQENGGNAAARNAGIARAQGDLIALLDQDDIWLPHKLSHQVAALQENPSSGFAICHAVLKLQEGIELPSAYSQEMAEGPFPAYLPSAMMIRRKALSQVGGFDTSYSMGNDSDWFFRARDAGVACVIVPEVLFEIRVHADNQGHDVRTMRSDMMKVLRASTKRKREKAEAEQVRRGEE